MDWQPIETAPKDGTSILGYPHFRVTHWQAEDCYPAPGWVSEWDYSLELYITDTKLSHWMPLPEPPQ